MITMQGAYIALIPAYQPTDVLFGLVQQLTSLGFSVILVDDGSGKEFKELFHSCSQYAKVLHHDTNKGKGFALKTGLAYIQQNCEQNSIVVTVDADGQHTPKDALAICQKAEQYRDSLVLGSRKLKGHIPLRSQFGNTITRMVYRLTTGLKVHDTQTGLRAFSKSLIHELLHISGERYEYEMNVLLEFARKGIPIHEVEIETIYFDKNKSSHFHALKDSYRIYKEILKFSVSSFIGFLVDYGMYSILLLLTGDLRYSNIGARIVSASVNYTINRKFVFKSKAGVVQSAMQYVLLAMVILCGNTIVLECFVRNFGIHQMFAKLITEMLFFIINWLIQRFIIFRRTRV